MKVEKTPPDSNISAIRAFIAGETSLASGEKERVAPLIWKLQEEWMYLWHRTKERGLVSEIVTLARRFRVMGEDKGVSVLALYGEALERLVMDFDLEGFEDLLGLYPRVVQALGREAE